MADATQKLLEELKQTRPFDTKQQAAQISILRTADVIRRRVNQLLDPYGITMQQYNVLRILRGADKGLATLSIGERLIEQTPGMTRLIDRLEAKQMVERRRSQDDRRQVLCFLTDTGKLLLDKLDQPIVHLPRELLTSLDDHKCDELISLLAMIWQRSN